MVTDKGFYSGQARLVKCPVCGGTGKWHADDGTECFTDKCNRPTTKCMLCNGHRTVTQNW